MEHYLDQMKLTTMQFEAAGSAKEAAVSAEAHETCLDLLLAECLKFSEQLFSVHGHGAPWGSRSGSAYLGGSNPYFRRARKATNAANIAASIAPPAMISAAVARVLDLTASSTATRAVSRTS